MEIVDILCDYSLKLALSLKPYKCLMSLVRSCIGIDKLTLIEIIEIFRMFNKEIMGDDIDRSVLSAALGIIDTRAASEVRNTALSRHTGSAKEHDIIGFRNKLFELFYLVIPYAAESVNPCLHKYTLN